MANLQNVTRDTAFMLHSETGSRACRNHLNKNCIYWCDTCHKPGCSICVTTSHRGHAMREIEEVICQRKDSLRKLKDPLEEYLKHMQKLLYRAWEMKTTYTGNIQRIDNDLVTHAGRIHEVVDTCFAKARKELQEISESKETALQEQENFLKEKNEEIERKLEELENLLQSNDISPLVHSFDIIDMNEFPDLIQQTIPSYIPGYIDHQAIMTMLGNLKVLPEIVSSFDTKYQFPFIACSVSRDRAWVRSDERGLQLMDLHGAVKDTISSDFDFNDVAITGGGDLLFTEHGSRRIMAASKTLRTWRIRMLFLTEYNPGALCSTLHGGIVVTYNLNEEHRMIRYSRNGTSLHEFDQNLFSNPRRVAANKVNNDLYVVDNNKLLVFGNDNNLRYKYAGYNATTFDPRDVCTDTNGCVLVTDKNSDRIHVLNMAGRLLQYIKLPGLHVPWFIDADSEGHAWIGEEKVQIVKY